VIATTAASGCHGECSSVLPAATTLVVVVATAAAAVAAAS
jgi:hypothetical protein